MTTVNDFTDILRIIREQPEWAEALRAALLSKELLELPQRFAEYTEVANRRFAALEGDVAELKAGQTRLEAGQTRLEGDVSELQSDVSELKAGQARLESDVAELKAGQARLEGQVSRLEGQIGNLRGDSYELKVGRIISSTMSDRMDIRVRILKSANLSDQSELIDLLHDAVGRGAISREDRSEVLQTDIVLKERGRPDAPALYVVVEVSVTVAGDDISRAAHRASILQKATGEQTIPFVVGDNVDDARRLIAQEDNVTLITIPQ